MIDNAIIMAYGFCFSLYVIAAFVSQIFHKSVFSVVMFQTFVFVFTAIFFELIVEFVRFMGMV